MPNIKSAKKRTKVIAVKTLRNKAFTSAMRTNIKKANQAIDTKASNSQDAVTSAIRDIDMAVSKGILHKNAAARKKSTLMRRLNQA